MKLKRGTIFTFFSLCFSFLAPQSNAQTQVWLKKIAPQVIPSAGNTTLKIDSAGNVYTAFTSVNTSFYFDITLAKYSSAGALLWKKTYSDASGKNDFVNALALDSAGNVYVAGSSQSATTGFDFVVLKYNTSGQTVWTKRYNGAANKDDFLSSLTIDSSDNVYVTGSEGGASSVYESLCTTIKYNSAGTRLWVKKEHPSGNDYDLGSGVSVATDGSVYVAGATHTTDNYDNAMFIKYNSAGTRQWLKTFDGAAHLDDAYYGSRIDSAGNIYVGGITSATDTDRNSLLVKYSPAGAVLWKKTYAGAAGGEDYLSDGVIDSSGNIYLVGGSAGSNFQDAFIWKLSPAGTTLYTRRVNIANPSSGDAGFISIALDNAGNYYVTGYCQQPHKAIDLYTAKYNSAGTQLWSKRYDDSTQHNVDSGVAIAVDPTTGAFYVVASSFYVAGSNYPGQILIKYQ